MPAKTAPLAKCSSVLSPNQIVPVSQVPAGMTTRPPPAVGGGVDGSWIAVVCGCLLIASSFARQNRGYQTHFYSLLLRLDLAGDLDICCPFAENNLASVSRACAELIMAEADVFDVAQVAGKGRQAALLRIFADQHVHFRIGV